MPINPLTQDKPASLPLRLALILLAFVLSGCLALTAPVRPSRSPTGPGSATAAGSPTAAGSEGTSGGTADGAIPTDTPSATATLPPARINSPTPRPPTAIPQPTAGLEPLACGPHPVTAEIVAELQPEPWMQWVRQLSGAEPVLLDGQETIIATRFTPAMFGPDGESGQANARAFDYLLQTIHAWYPAEQIEVQSFRATSREGETLHGKNLILTLPGAGSADIASEEVILSAHLDSMSRVDPELRAPGAEDNASGSATLLEAARLFRGRQFERTIRMIWFTGEEQGLLGSRYYVLQLREPQRVLGVINLDMFGYDSDGDGCFELHVGTLPASERVGQCFVESVAAYEPGLEPFDYLTVDAIGGSDHGPFWSRGIGAVEVLENMFDNERPDGCPNADSNPAYHSPEDTHEKLNPDSAIRIVRAALASAAAMALPLERAP